MVPGELHRAQHQHATPRRCHLEHLFKADPAQALGRRDDARIGAVLATVKGSKARYAAKGDEIYVRARVTSSKRHSNPYAQGDLEMAWTQPLVTPR